MSIEAKIHLSKLEMELVKNTEWILTKQAIIDKVYLLFGKMNDTYQGIWEKNKNLLPLFDIKKGAKISKGENYMGLPYVMLDYPALFNRDKIFAIRTMFWWGNFFSITLHISGSHIRDTLNISNLLFHLQHTGFSVCINENEWQHHFESDNYIDINDIDEKLHTIICSRNFFKISKKISLKNWGDAPGFLEKSYLELIEFIKINFPTDEKALLPVFPKVDSGL